MNKKIIHVAVGIIRNPQYQIYVTQRSKDSDFSGFLEFPGGKVEAQETSAAALVRELEEEVGITPIQYHLYEQLCFDYPHKSVKLDFYLVTEWKNQPFGKEGQKGQWITITQLDSEKFPSANQKIIQHLQQQYVDESAL